MKKILAPQKSPDIKDAPNFTNVEELVKQTNEKLNDTMMYIGAIGHRYRWDLDFVLKTRKEAEALVKHNKAIFYHKDKNTDFFVYNERSGDLVPFKKKDYLTFDHGYLVFVGKDYISYDDLGNEIWRFPFADKPQNLN